MEDELSECAVCREALGAREAFNCPHCNSTLCTRCVVKIAFSTPMDADHDEAAVARFETCDRPIKCPECRCKLMIDVREIYFRVMDRLDEFTEKERQFIVFLSQRDLEFEENRQLWANNHPLKHFKQGVTVRLHGLKAKKQWNGKKAMIIGKGVIKQDTFRWPIQVMDGSKTRALLRQCNMDHMQLADRREPYGTSQLPANVLRFRSKGYRYTS